MLKIVRNIGTAYEMGEPVTIDNTVYIPVENDETGEVLSEEEIAASQQLADEMEIPLRVRKYA